MPGLFTQPGTGPGFSLDAAGVVNIASSISRSIAMSSEELFDSESESEPNILIELTELDKFVLSFGNDHSAFD
jgi:hypothetical protein